MISKFTGDIKVYGSGRLYWEGGPRGEGTLSTVKELFKGQHPSWALSLMRKFYQKWTLKQLRDTLDLQGQATDAPDSAKLCRESYRRYSSTDEIVNLAMKGQALSGVRIEGNRVLLLLENTVDGKKILRAYEVEFDSSEGSTEYLPALDMCFVSISSLKPYTRPEQDLFDIFEDYVVMLPRFDGSGKAQVATRARYYVVTSSWKERQKTGQFCTMS